jgi:hypothetical protein
MSAILKILKLGGRRTPSTHPSYAQATCRFFFHAPLAGTRAGTVMKAVADQVDHARLLFTAAKRLERGLLDGLAMQWRVPPLKQLPY